MTQAQASNELRFASQEAVGDAVASGLLESMGLEIPATPDIPPPEPDAEPEAEQEAVAEATPSEPQTQAPVTSVEEWVERVRANPSSISGVPGNLRIAVTQGLLEGERTAREKFEQERKEIELRAVRIAAERGIEQGRQEVLAQQRYAQIDAMAQSDPASFTKWANENPQGAQWYYQWRSQGGVKALVEQEPVNRALITSAQTVLGALSSNPELHASAVQQAQRENLPTTAEGLQRLTMIVAEHLARGAPAAAAASPPAPKPTLKDVPRPEGVSASGTAPVPRAPQLSNDISTLLEEGLTPTLKRARREGNRTPEE